MTTHFITLCNCIHVNVLRNLRICVIRDCATLVHNLQIVQIPHTHNIEDS